MAEPLSDGGGTRDGWVASATTLDFLRKRLHLLLPELPLTTASLEPPQPMVAQRRWRGENVGDANAMRGRRINMGSRI